MIRQKMLTRIIACLLIALFVVQPIQAFAADTDSDVSQDITNPSDQPSGDNTDSDQTANEDTDSGTSTDEGTSPDQSTGEDTDSDSTTDGGSDPDQSADEGTNSDPSTDTGSDSEQPSDGDQDTGESAEPFSCYTYDAQGNVLDGYWSEKDNTWYLFVTSTQSVADTVLYYTGSITEASTGQLDTQTATVTGAFTESADQVNLTASDETVYSVVVMQSQLPSVYITLEGTTLDDIHADKDTKHPGNSVSITDPNGTYDLNVEGSVEIKGRGNSTWECYEKKGYQIKFDKKTSVMGMGKAKKWVLLANASDDSMMRTQLVYRMAEELGMAYVPSFEYVDLWIAGEYRGTYILGEKIEPGSSRLDLSDDAGVLFESDEAFYMAEDYWFYSTYLRYHFVMKEIVTEEDDFIAAAMADFEASVDELAAYLYSTPSEEVTLDELSAYIDVDSFIKYFLINEYVMNKESFVSSFYWYKDGPEDVIHLGPIWDFDTCMGNDGTANTESYGQEYFLFSYLLAVPEFYERTLELEETYKANLTSMTADTDVIKAHIADSAEMNYLRWDVLGKPNPKGGSDFHATFDEAVSAVKSWLQGRETAFEVVQSKAVTSVVSEDCYEMELYLQGDEAYQTVRFGVWSTVDGQDDLTWYEGYQDTDGVWRCTVDLTNHNSAGIYRIDAYANGVKPWVATGCSYVEIARESPYTMSAEVSEDCEVMTITLQDSNFCSEISFVVWSDENSQDDLRWYPAERNSDGNWVSSVDLKAHHSAGMYIIHAYTVKDGARKLVDTHTADVEFAVYGPTVTAEVSSDGTGIEWVLTNVSGYERVWAGVWSNENDQDDLTWYEAAEHDDGTWAGTVNLLDHGDLGTYQIHVYGTKDGADAVIAACEILVETAAFPGKTVPVYRLYNPYTSEHLFTCSEAEMEQLLTIGWLLDGTAWESPESGDMVYRLYNPYDDWHTYSMSQEEIDILTGLGWQVDGSVCCSVAGDNGAPIYRLFNPYEPKCYHLLTASAEECDWLISLGWQLDGVALYAVPN